MAGLNGNGNVSAAMKRALQLATEALDLLDAHGGPAEAAVHFELARQILRDRLAQADA
jgi:hypothetical protein